MVNGKQFNTAKPLLTIFNYKINGWYYLTMEGFYNPDNLLKKGQTVCLPYQIISFTNLVQQHHWHYAGHPSVPDFPD